MRVALWLAGLFAAAAALALLAGDNNGTVTVFWPPHRVDLSLNLALLLAALLLLLHLAWRTLSAALALPERARRWRAQQRERASHAALLDALIQQEAGRFLRARKAAENALAHDSATDTPAPHALALRTLAHLLAAESAHALQDADTRQTHFDQALALAGQPGASAELREGLLLHAARWALQTQDYGAALAQLHALPVGAQRRTAALRLRLQAAHQADRAAEALETARLLHKHRALSPHAARGLINRLATDVVAQTPDRAQLQALWHSLPTHERQQPPLALAAAQRLLALGGEAALARQWLHPVWNALLTQPDSLSSAQRARLLHLLQASLSRADPADHAATDHGSHAWLARLENAQHSHPGDAGLQYLAGMACLHRGLWGKAQLLLTQAVRGLQTPSLRRDAWRGLARLAEQRGDAAAAAQAWKQAAMPDADSAAQDTAHRYD